MNEEIQPTKLVPIPGDVVACLSLAGARADQRHDQEERESYQEIDSPARDEAHNSMGPC
jgi:hypothetical protein